MDNDVAKTSSGFSHVMSGSAAAITGKKEYRRVGTMLAIKVERFIADEYFSMGTFLPFHFDPSIFALTLIIPNPPGMATRLFVAEFEDA